MKEWVLHPSQCKATDSPRPKKGRVRSERANWLNRKLDRFLGIPLVALSSVLRFCHHSKGNPLKIGIICLGAIGDLLLLSSLTGSLREYLDSHNMKETRLYLLTTPANAGAVSLIPGISEHKAFPVRQIFSLLKTLRNWHLDVLIDTSQWARIGALLSLYSGSKHTIGFETAGQYRSLGYDQRVLHRSDQHEYLNFLSLGQALFPDLTGKPHIIVPEELPREYTYLREFTGAEWIYFHMWASGTLPKMKEWSPEYWAELAQKLLSRKFKICLTGSRQDMPRTEAFLQTYFPREQNIISLAGKNTLPVLAWLLVRAKAMISVNTGIMHLAALCGTPTIGLHGGTNPLRWGPVGKATISLLPRKGAFAFLNLGFEYPKGIISSLPFLPVEDVLNALQQVNK